MATKQSDMEFLEMAQSRFAKGEHPKDIARSLGVHETTVRSRIVRLGYTLESKTEYQITAKRAPELSAGAR